MGRAGYFVVFKFIGFKNRIPIMFRAKQFEQLLSFHKNKCFKYAFGSRNKLVRKII